MMKNFIQKAVAFTTMVALTLTACSHNEVTEKPTPETIENVTISRHENSHTAICPAETDAPSVSDQSQKVEETNMSVPVLLSQDGKYWTDQNNEVMEFDAVKNFFGDNPDYASEIIYLNENPYYTFVKHSKHHLRVLNDLRQEFCANSFKSDSNLDMVVAALHAVMQTPPSERAFDVIIKHLNLNGAVYDVETLKEQHADVTKLPHNSHSMANYLFFGTLARCFDSVNFEKIYGVKVMSVMQAPVILSADHRTWLDQNGLVMNAEEAMAFLESHEEYAWRILNLNQNPYYLDSWYNQDREVEMEELRETLLASVNANNDIEEVVANENDPDYLWALRDALNDAPQRKTLQSFRHKLSLNAARESIDELMNLMKEAESTEKIDLTGISCYEVPDCIFWCAVAKITDNDIFQTSFPD